MKDMKGYTVITLGEFFETCEIESIDKFFDTLNSESVKRSYMVSKSLTEYLKGNASKYSKYDALKATL